MAEESKEEIALYDRQIRLWGLAAQKRLKSGNVLLVGIENPHAHEIAKNLVLAGIGTLSILSQHGASLFINNKDILSTLFFTADSLHKKRANVLVEKLTLLNPNVKLVVLEPSSPNEMVLPNLKDFDLVALCLLDLERIKAYSLQCREANVKLYLSASKGFFGWNLCDYINHSYKENQSQVPTLSADATTPPDTVISLCYPPLYRVLDWLEDTSGLDSHLSSFHSNMNLNKRQKKKQELALKKFCLLWNKAMLLTETVNSITSNSSDPFSSDPDLTEWYQQLSSAIKQDEVAPVVSVVAAHASQDIIRGISQSGRPLHNAMYFDGFLCEGQLLLLGTLSSSFPHLSSLSTHS